MDCPTCRSLFSQSFDGRLAGECRQDFAHHVLACGPCESEFALYRRVFSTIRGLPDGEALPFRAPAEVPGALASVQAYSARPRFARVAAGFLILIGLVGTHVLVFQWSRDHASRAGVPTSNSQTSSATPPLAVASMSLPPALRDHVDATDLFIKTIAKLPDDAAGRDLARADWVASGLPQLTKELRNQSFNVADRWRVDRYLQAMEDEFVPRMRGLLEGETPQSIAAIRNAAIHSRVRFDLGGMKMLVASLPHGTFFASRPAGPEAARLSPDGRLVLASKRARLAGQLPAAIDFLKKFEDNFRKSSSLNPAAVYLQFDALAAAGKWDDALNAVRQSKCVPCTGVTVDSLGQALQFITLRAPAGSGMAVQWLDDGDLQFGGSFKFAIIKSEGVPQYLVPVPVPVAEDIPEPPAAPKK